MSRLPAVLPVAFGGHVNTIPVTLPLTFGYEFLQSGETVTATTTSAIGRVIFADCDLSATAATDTAVDRAVFASDDALSVTASDDSSANKTVYGESSTEVTADISSVMEWRENKLYSDIIATVGLDSSANVTTSSDTSLSLTASEISSSSVEAVVATSLAGQFDSTVDSLHVANVDASLSVDGGPFGSLELDAKATTHLAAGPVPTSLVNLLAAAESGPLLVTVGRSSTGHLTAYVSSITAVDADIQSSEQSSVVVRSLTTVAVQLDSVANVDAVTGTSSGITAAVASQIRSLVIGNTELNVTDVPDTFISLHQTLDSSTLIEFDSFAIGTLPLIFINVPVDIREASVAASARNVLVPNSIVVSVSVPAVDRDSVVGSALRDSVVVEAGRFVAIAAEGDPRTAPVMSTRRLSNSLFA